MIAIYNINSNLNKISENVMQITGVMNENVSIMKPILTETWRGACMGILAHFDNPF